MLNKDYKELLQNLKDNDVRFIVVGAYALGVHGCVRATGDIDIWVENEIQNSKEVYKALSEFGAPIGDIEETTFTEEGIIFQIGVAPRRIDIITRIDGVEFQEAYKNRLVVNIDNLDIPFLSKKDLITNKRSTGRQKDKIDAEWLSKTEE